MSHRRHPYIAGIFQACMGATYSAIVHGDPKFIFVFILKDRSVISLVIRDNKVDLT